MPRAAKKFKGKSVKRKVRRTGVITPAAAAALNDCDIPLLKAIKWQLEHVRTKAPPNQLLDAVLELHEAGAKRIKAMLNGKSESAHRSALETMRLLQTAKIEAETTLEVARYETVQQVSGDLTSRRIAELQAEVEKLSEASSSAGDPTNAVAGVAATLLPEVVRIIDRKFEERALEHGTAANSSEAP